MRLLAVLALLGAVSFGAPAGATHTPDHRFLLIGYVSDGAGRPLADVSVVVTRVKTGLTYRTRTEVDGIYFVVLHLHDEDQGDRLTVAANAVTADVTARFDPRDRRFERGTRVDFRGDGYVEDRPSFPETLRAYLAR